jgi:hypothetical protein
MVVDGGGCEEDTLTSSDCSTAIGGRGSDTISIDAASPEYDGRRNNHSQF